MDVRSRPAPWCAALARALEEPLPGTAPSARRWVCLEHRGTWPPDISAHRDPAVRAFLHRVTAAGWRPLLVRRPGRRATDGPTRVFLVDTAPANPQLTVLRVGDPAELAGLVLPGPGEPLPGTAVADPMLLVCTHGRRDRCCAVDGRALTRAVLAAAGEDEGASRRTSGRTWPESRPSDPGAPEVWECTHLGGHRFAPTALVLPTGYVYGRLDAPGAVAALKAAGVGEVEPALCRGRSTWSAPGQVAELAVRAATGLRGADALSVDEPGLTGTDDARVVVTARDGRRWEVTVRSAACPGGSRPVSCGAAALPVTALHASAVTPLTEREHP